MKRDVKGCSTCPNEQERYETFSQFGRTFYQYDYRDADGDLFSTVRQTLEQCRQERGCWLQQKQLDEMDRELEERDVDPCILADDEEVVDGQHIKV